MLQLAWKNLLFRRMRALLTILGIASSITLVVLMNAIMAGMEQGFLKSFDHMANQVRIQAKSQALDGNSIDTTPAGRMLDAQAISRILSTAKGYDPQGTSPVVVQDVLASPSPNQPALMTVYGVEPGKEQVALRGVDMAAGEARLAGKQDVVIGATAHKELNKHYGRTVAVGEQVEFRGVPGTFTITGIAAPRDPYTDGVVVMDISTARSAFGRGDTANFVILAFPVDKVKALAPQLAEQFADYDVVTAEVMLETVDKAMGAQRSFFRLINGTVYCTAVAIIFMVMYAAVMERTREIGTMRAVGAPRRAIVGGVIAEAVVMAAVGAVLATIPAWAVIYGWEMLPFADFVVEAVKNIAVVMAVGVVSALYPAIRASRINPLEALRYE